MIVGEKMTVHERIKQMNVDEMAQYFVKKNKICDMCIYNGKCKGLKVSCVEGVKRFLEIEVL